MVKTIVLDGGVTRVDHLGAYNAGICNNSDSWIYAGKTDDIEPYADGVIAIPAGGRDILAGCGGVVYILGSGMVEVRGVNNSNFNIPSSRNPYDGGGANSSYVLPPATRGMLGGVIIGDGLDVSSSGKISVSDDVATTTNIFEMLSEVFGTL